MVPAKIVEKAGLALLAEFLEEEFVGVAQGVQGLILFDDFLVRGIQLFPERGQAFLIIIDDLLLPVVQSKLVA